LSCGPSEEEGQQARRSDRANELRHVIVLSQVLTDERSERQLCDLDEIDRTARHLHRLPPADMRVEYPAEVVLIDLRLVERTSGGAFADGGETRADLAPSAARRPSGIED
jgi:hypothetical protein